jgi:hypothetical protein
MSKRGAAFELVDEVESPDNLLPDELVSGLDLLESAHANFQAADKFDANAISRIDQKIKALERKRSKRTGARKNVRENAAGERSKSFESLKVMLEDPESTIHPVLRAVLLAPSSGTGSLENPRTFSMVRRLGIDMLKLNGHLESQDESLPTAVVGQSFDYERQHVQMQFRYGFTTPNTGLSPGMGQRVASWHSSGVTEHVPQPTLILPIEEATLNAVSPSGDNSHYVYANKEARVVDHFGRSEHIKLAPQDFVPEIRDLELPLPTATFDNLNTARPFIYYGNEDDNVEVINLPKILGVGDRVTCAIGNSAVYHLLVELNSKNAGMDAEQRRVLRNMSLTIAHQGLGLALKRGDFLRKALVN